MANFTGSLPLRYLTEPSRATGNQGWDNENSDLILGAEDVLVSNDSRRYIVKDVLGQGTFGQVVKCLCEESSEAVAVKVIKNQTAFYHQARVEVGVLQYLNKRADAEDRHHIVRMRDHFLFKNHLCLVFELMSVNLYELVKHNRFKGLSLTLLRVFITQILDALTVLRESNIIHCDLKPENVLLKSLDSGDVKVIDFGSACFENKTMYSYIQSRFYRSPEVLMGHPYNAAIDMWSLGCMAAELFLGLPLFPGASEHDLLVRVMEMMGPLPDKILQRAQHTGKYFRKVEEAMRPANGAAKMVTRYYLRSQAEFEALHGQPAPAGKRYFQHIKLADIIGAYPYKSGISDEEMGRECRRREAFLDFLMGVLGSGACVRSAAQLYSDTTFQQDLDPASRWSPRQALQHPFITNQPFRGPFQPTPDPHIPIRSTSFQPGSAPAASPYGLAASPLSPEAHEQAHAAALAAVNAHFSPRAAHAYAGGGSALRSTVNEPPSPMSTSYYGPSYGLPTPNRRGQHEFAGEPPSATMDGVQWGQLSPHYSSGALPIATGLLPIGSVNSGALMRSGSLAAVLAPWQQGGADPIANQPIGSLEALRAACPAPHNTYQSAAGSGYGVRSRRMGSGNLGSANFSNLISPSSYLHSVEATGLPPLPANGLQSEFRSDATAATDTQRPHFRRSSYDEAINSSLGFSSSHHAASTTQDYAAFLAAPGGALPQNRVGLPPPSPPHQKGAQPVGRRDSSDFGHGLNSAFQNVGRATSREGSCLTGGPPSQRASTDLQSGWPKPPAVLWQQEQALQLNNYSDPPVQRLAHMASGESEPIPEPGDWDPLYSDDQLLSEEQVLRRNDSNVGQTPDMMAPRSRPASGSVPDSQVGGWTGRPAASLARHIPMPQAQQQAQAASGSFNAVLAQQQLQGMSGRDALGNQLDLWQPEGVAASFDHQLRPLEAQPGDLASQLSHSHGSYPGGIETWQHPELSASLYTLPEVPPPFGENPRGISSLQPDHDSGGAFTRS